MTRHDLILATAAALFAAFLLGWCAHWLLTRLSRVTRADLARMDRLVHQVHEAEEARERALSDRAATDARLAEATAQADAARAALTESRAEIEELRDYIDKRLTRADRA